MGEIHCMKHPIHMLLILECVLIVDDSGICTVLTYSLIA